VSGNFVDFKNEGNDLRFKVEFFPVPLIKGDIGVFLALINLKLLAEICRC